jgi:hypothetical protein
MAVGALINMLLIWMFDLRLRNAFIARGSYLVLTGTMICLIVLLDNPYRGEVGVATRLRVDPRLDVAELGEHFLNCVLKILVLALDLLAQRLRFLT